METKYNSLTGIYTCIFPPVMPSKNDGPRRHTNQSNQNGHRNTDKQRVTNHTLRNRVRRERKKKARVLRNLSNNESVNVRRKLEVPNTKSDYVNLANQQSAVTDSSKLQHQNNPNTSSQQYQKMKPPNGRKADCENPTNKQSPANGHLNNGRSETNISIPTMTNPGPLALPTHKESCKETIEEKLQNLAMYTDVQMQSSPLSNEQEDQLLNGSAAHLRNFE